MANILTFEKSVARCGRKGCLYSLTILTKKCSPIYEYVRSKANEQSVGKMKWPKLMKSIPLTKECIRSRNEKKPDETHGFVPVALPFYAKGGTKRNRDHVE